MTACDPIVITGLGIITPLGVDVETSWKGLLSNRHAFRELTATDVWPAMPVLFSDGNWYGGGISWPNGLWTHLEKYDPVTVLAEAVANAAIKHARLTAAECQSPRMGWVFGTSKGGLHAASRSWRTSRRSDHTPDPWWPQTWCSYGASHLARTWQSLGPVLSPVAACATGTVAIIRGWQLLKEGVCDWVLAGAADYSLHPAVLASFQRMGVLSRTPHSEYPVRPFDRQRSGFLIGAGAGAVILERASTAKTRGVTPLAVIVSAALGCDPTGLVNVSPSGDTLFERLRRMLPARAKIDLIHAHGTATTSNDLMEGQALQRGIQECDWQIQHITASKGALGHLLGASGSVELALACLCLRDSIVPPITGLRTPMEGCALPLALETKPVTSLNRVLKLSYGFGGHLAAVLLERYAN